MDYELPEQSNQYPSYLPMVAEPRVRNFKEKVIGSLEVTGESKKTETFKKRIKANRSARTRTDDD